MDQVHTNNIFLCKIFQHIGMNIGKISKKGQIVIPKEIRDKFGIKPGDVIIFRIKNDKIILEKIKDKLSDILKNSKPIEKSLDFQKKLREEWE